MEAIADYRIYDFNYPELLGVLAHVHPFVFLDAFLGTSKIKDSRGLIFSNLNEHFGNPINQISDKDIIAWCEQEPDKRYPLAASAIDPFTESEKSGACEWKPIVFKILEKAPMLKAVLRYFSYPYGIMQSVWSGSLADIIEKRSVLFVSLFDHKNPEIRTWAKNQHTTLNQVILNERKREEADKLGKYESFE